jgi:hypothetical protein
MSKRQFLRRFEVSPKVGLAPGWLGAAAVLAGLAGLLICGVLPWPATAARGAQSAASTLAATDALPDLEQRLAKWKHVNMRFDDSTLSVRERQLLHKLIAACRQLESIYWRQSDAPGLALYKALADGSTAVGPPPTAATLRRLLWINGSRWDLLDENRPLAGTEPMPPGRGLFPPGLTRQQIDAYVAAHPAARKGIYDEHTVIRKQDDKLVAVPYHTAYREFLAPAAQDLRDAAALSDDPAFAKFLRLRAAALLSDDYYASDLAWLDMVNPKFDLIYAPYETYLDDLLGVKTSYGAAVLIRNDTESAKLAVFQKYVPDIQDALPLPPADRPSKRGHVAPMEVMDSPFRAGDLRHGYQAVADNLPNDPRVHELKGSKQIFFKNFMDVRVNDIILPLAQRVMRRDQAVKASADGYLAGVMMHEICHGLGPAYAHPAGKRMDIRAAVGPVYSGLEEAKADATGMFGLAWLVAHGALPQARLEEYYVSYVAGIFRTVRFGTAEPHSRAEMMELNFLTQKGAVSRDPASGLYAIDFARIPGAFAALTLELLQIEATGDRARAEAWFAKYSTMPPELKTTLGRAAGLEVDIDPHDWFAEAQQVE